MSDLISQIHQDHLNMARILKLINSEIEALAAEEPRNLEILDDAMRYMINFADKIHHAKEDIMLSRLREVAPETREMIEDIFAEHQEIFKKGTEFQELVRAVEFGDFVLRDKIVAKGTDYVNTLYAHMSKEEENLLKRAREVLTDEDFAELDLNHGPEVDPLFGEKIQKEYKDLYTYIVDQYGDDWRHPAHRVV
ncbi:MAG: hemerythrin domain-containing protein [Arenicellales bacterium]|nr:hemerythrin domain-containing protein [Arenicellales bacterium]